MCWYDLSAVIEVAKNISGGMENTKFTKLDRDAVPPNLPSPPQVRSLSDEKLQSSTYIIVIDKTVGF